MGKLRFILLCLFIGPFLLNAQVILTPDPRFKEEAIRQKLLEQGINLDDFSPDQIIEMEAALQRAIDELEREQAIQSNDSIPLISAPAPLTIGKPDSIKVDLAVVPADSTLTDTTQSIAEAAIFGQQIFRNSRLEVFDRSDHRKASPLYVLGPGDEINVSFWGESQRSFSFEVNRDGYIKPDQLPRIYLKGLTLTQARELLQRSFQKAYLFRPSQFEVTVSYARDITVHIVGEVLQYGSFTLPATNTAFNALMLAGGPTDIGSVRNIRLVRSGEPARTLDVYRFLLDPDASQEVYLQNNDFLHVAVADRVVEVEGAVKRPFKYELTEGENLVDLLKYAGGLSNNAFSENIQVTRRQDGKNVLLDVNLRKLAADNADFELENGDIVLVRTIPVPLDRYVQAKGAVRFPGEYEHNDEMRVSDLVGKSILEESARLDIAFLIKTGADSTVSYQRIFLAEALESPGSGADVLLQQRDRLLVLSQKDYKDEASVVIKGAVRNPSEYAYHRSGLKVEDAILLAGGLRPDATTFAYIHRGDPSHNNPIQYLRVDLNKALTDPASGANLGLAPFDTLIVFSKLTFRDEQSVSVRGAVRSPGDFQYDESLTLKDVLTMSGGLLPEAATNRIDIFRLDYKNNQPTKTIFQTLEVDAHLNLSGHPGSSFQLMPSDQVVVRQAPEYAIQRNVNIVGEVRYPGIYALTDKNETLLTVLQRAGGLTNGAFPEGATLYRPHNGKGFVILDLKEALKNDQSVYNYILKDGDVVEVPSKEDLVTLYMKGTKAADLYPAKVLTQGKFNVAYHKGRNAKWYVEKYAAGLGRKAKKRYITVEHPNGAIEQTRGFLFFKKYPSVQKGSIISVGEKRPKKQKPREENKTRTPWRQVLAETVAQATAVITLILLIERL